MSKLVKERACGREQTGVRSNVVGLEEFKGINAAWVTAYGKKFCLIL